MKIDKLYLLEKGWKASEIEHASKIIEKSEQRSHLNARWFDRSIYFALLFLLIIANIVFSIFLVPFLFAIKSDFVILIVAILGFVLGVMFSILIIDIQKNNEKSHMRLLITLIASGIVNFGLIVRLTHDFSISSGLLTSHNPYTVGFVYLVSFLIPHTVYMISHKVISHQ